MAYYQIVRKISFSFIWVCLSWFGLLAADDPSIVYLTWISDPSTSMTILWHTDRDHNQGRAPTNLLYHRDGDPHWQKAQGASIQVAGNQVEVHRVELEGLMENARYIFKMEGGTQEYRFRTLPKTLTRPVRIAIGGDMYYPGMKQSFHQMNQMIAQQDPDFIVMGGDLAYINSRKGFFKEREGGIDRWQLFLRDLQKTVRGKDGRLIPLLPVVGNHDIHKSRSFRKGADLFYQIFAFPEQRKAYRALDVGNYLSLVMLDTGHTYSVKGDQTAWLKRTLEKRGRMPYLWCAYHVAAYPSFYPFDDRTSQEIRSSWVPLFEKYGVSLAFEHHNHRYKRTYPLRAGKKDPNGVVYLGDGSWGVEPRPATEVKSHWYLARSESINACYFVTLAAQGCSVEARNAEGELIDRLLVTPRN